MSGAYNSSRKTIHTTLGAVNNLCMAIKTQEDLEFDAKDASSFLFTQYGEVKKCVHRKMLHARKTTSGAECEGHTSLVTESLSIF